MNKISNNSEYNNLIVGIAKTLNTGRKQAYQSVNDVLAKTYWNIGKLIVKYEQKGKEKAEYGSGLLKNLAKELTRKFGKGFSKRNLELMRKFYLFYPEEKTQTLSAQFPISTTSPSKSQENQTSDQSFKLSWSHYVRLITIKDSNERNFYEIECIQNNWSIREFNRQFDSALYQRLALSKDKTGIKKLSQKGQIIEKPEDSLKEPYILEFLGLKEHHQYSESDLETAIINNLEKFLLELGKGFTFVARQQRITNGLDHYFIDLVFYNRLLKCFVLVDLKIGKIKHQDIGQMQMYTNYYDREVKTDAENLTVGIILCRENNHFVVEYTLPKGENQVFAKEYQLYLPKKEELEAEVKKLLNK